MSPRSTIAHYCITSKLGQGGMGEVWRATDTKLNREVAIKILPDVFAQDADRMARFSREAQVLASLNHPHIAALYGLEERALVMELVPGPTLAERIAQGPIPLDEALSLAKQIAEALEYAHERGVVHRDLKPANIKITPEGVVKVLDFGLAKVTDPVAPAGDAANSPTLTIASEAGMIMGTAAYMSPEQARGGVVDKRADIWAFGVVLYEMLTRRPLFAGPTVSDTLAAVLRHEPNYEQVPLRVRRLIQRCLEKDPKKRLRDVGDAMPLLEDAPAVTMPTSKHKLAWAVAGALAIMAVALWVAWRATRSGAESSLLPLTRLSVDLGPDAMTGINLTAAISPDGRRLVFPARAANGQQQLATRLLDQAQASLLPGTENGHDPFFSPDSQWIGFFASGKLKKISALGGAAVTLCDAPFPYGASWGEDGTIVAALSLLSPLSRVPAAGGRPQPFPRLGKDEITHRWPQLLPGGQAVLLTAAPNSVAMESASVAVISLPGGAVKKLITGGYFARYVPANGKRGYLVYLHQGVLSAVAFDPIRLELQGTPVPILEDVAGSPILGGGQFGFSAAPSGHGTLLYLEGKGAAQTWPVMWLGSSGNMQPLIATPGQYSQPRFSPDGRRLALMMSTSGGSDIYVYELGRETLTRLTFGEHSAAPVWTPDGQRIAFLSSGSDSGIGWIRSDGSGEPQQILAVPNNTNPWSFSPDGRRLAYFQNNSETGFDIATLPLDTSDPDHPKAGKPEPFLATPSDELVPMFSPDGRWIAYRSNESGTNEVYVRPFPGGRGGKWQISTGGGLYGIWSNNGRELFYETGDNRIMVVDYTVSADSFLPGKPRLWSEKQIFYAGVSNLALAPDGKRFAVFPMPEAAGPEKGSVRVTFLLNFADELRRRLP
jgi:Tol biopolymer transport system component